jgi:hypothetical protein
MLFFMKGMGYMKKLSSEKQRQIYGGDKEWYFRCFKCGKTSDAYQDQRICVICMQAHQEKCGISKDSVTFYSVTTWLHWPD